MPRSPRSFTRSLTRWLKRLTLLAIGGLVVVVAGGGALYVYFDRDLPSVEELRNYRPPQVTKVYCTDGSLCGEFYRERRTWVQIETLPPHVKNAFLAAEDADFYRHEGLDFISIVRAALRSILLGKRVTGASTISQQACRNLLLTRKRELSRKIRELILTPRMERALTKDQILNLYLNTINFGHRRYGVEEAALFYFGKHARELTVGEAAVLGGVPQLPERINPVTNIVKAKRRQRYVLAQMARHGFLPGEIARAEAERPIVLGPRPPPRVGDYYIEEVRRQLVARYGEKAVLEGGLRVRIAMDVELQAHADTAVREGLEALDVRQGFRGPIAKLEPARFQRLREPLSRRAKEAGKRRPDERLVPDLEPLVAALGEGASTPKTEDEGTEAADPPESGEEQPSPDELIARAAPLRPLREGLRLAAFVSEVDARRDTATIDLIGAKATLPLKTSPFTKARGHRGAPLLAPGDVVGVKIVTIDGDAVVVALDQRPLAQAALVAIDPATRHVVALVGGYDFQRSAFNRATQAKRQPGSAFKPFLYAAALASQRFTPVSILNDAPEAIRDPYTGKTWKPQNYEKGGFDGPMTLRAALTHSKNTISVRLIEALTPEVTIELARRVGILSPLPNNLTLALGTGEVSVLELTNAYTTLQSLGRHADPLMLLSVTDLNGKVLEEHHASPDEVLPPPVAYLTTSLMRSVVEEGTATAVRELNRPAAGKTGTAQESRDAWFAGYTAQLVTTAWVGFDDHRTLGAGETGGKAALPVWLSFMRRAHEGLPARDFEAPTGVALVRVDPATGLLAGDAVPGRLEPFLEGTEPTAQAPRPGQVTPTDYFLDTEARGNP